MSKNKPTGILTACTIVVIVLAILFIASPQSTKASAMTALTLSQNPSTSGGSVTFTAAVTPTTASYTPTGSATSRDGTCTLESSSLSSGQTTYAASALSVGNHTVTPVLGGDANFAANTNTALTQTLNYASQTFGWTYCNSIAFQTDDPSLANQVFQGVGNIGSWYLIGPWYSSAFFWETVMYFDIDQYIAGKTIQSAELQLGPLDLPADFGTTYAVSPLAWGWNPATVTWNNCPNRYTSPKSVAPPPYSTTTHWDIDITAIVQAWASGSIDNNGVIIYDNQVAWPQVSLIRWFSLYAAQLYIACDAAAEIGDVNNDDHVNILDMVRVGQHWGQTGSPGWIPEDATEDGVINVLDMIVIGQHWTG